LAATAPIDSERPNGPRSRKGARTRARLVEAAKEIFEENGFLEARISDISERAGLSHGSFYHYFDSKEEIFREVAVEIEDQLSQAVDTVILDGTSTASPRERLRVAIGQFLERYREEAPIVGVIEQVSRYDDEMKAVRLARQRHYNEEVADSIRQLQQHGLADPSLDPGMTAWMLGAMTTRFAEMWLVQHYVECDFYAAVEHMSRLFANALCIDDGAPGPGRPHRRR
jgi:AcrR family transcriptional regulator